MTTVTVQTHAPVATHRGATLIANVLAHLMNWLEEVGRARAAGAIRRMEATRVTEAAQLRLYAQRWVDYDPRFTADLLAAADRHERTDE